MMTEAHMNFIRKLREETGASLITCKRMYCEADCDYDKALTDLRKSSMVTTYVTSKPIK